MPWKIMSLCAGLLPYRSPAMRCSPGVSTIAAVGQGRGRGHRAAGRDQGGSHGIRFIPHGWNTAVDLAADLQLASAFSGTDLVEYMTGSAYIDELAVGGLELDAEGLLPIPDAPGLGLQLSAYAMARYSSNGYATAE